MKTVAEQSSYWVSQKILVQEFSDITFYIPLLQSLEGSEVTILINTLFLNKKLDNILHINKILFCEYGLY